MAQLRRSSRLCLMFPGVIAIWLLLVMQGANASGGCSLYCEALDGAAQSRCVLWEVLDRLDLKEDLWIKHLTCDQYVAFENSSWPDFVQPSAEWPNTIQSIDLSGRVKGGTLGPEINDFRFPYLPSLETFRCSGCNLTGPFPEFNSVNNLDLSHNQLTGRVPIVWFTHGYFTSIPSAIINVSYNPQLRAKASGYFPGYVAPLAIDVSHTAVRPPFALDTLQWYCEGRWPGLNPSVLISDAFSMESVCQTLNLRTQAILIWTVLLGVVLAGTGAVYLYARHAAAKSRAAPAWQTSDTEASYVAIPAPPMGTDNLQEPLNAVVDSHPPNGTSQTTEDDSASAATPIDRQSARHFLIGMSLAQMIISGPLMIDIEPWGWVPRIGLCVWLPVWLIPHVLCALVMHAATTRGQSWWIKVSLAPLSIPLMAACFVPAWLSSELRASATQAGITSRTWMMQTSLGLIAMLFVLLASPILSLLLPSYVAVPIIVGVPSLLLLLLLLLTVSNVGEVHQPTGPPTRTGLLGLGQERVAKFLLCVLTVLLSPVQLTLLLPVLLVSLMVWLCSLPVLDFSSLLAYVASVCRKLDRSSHTYVNLLHWATGLVQAPLLAVLITFKYMWWHDEIVFNPFARHLFMTELILPLSNLALHLVLLTYSYHFNSGPSNWRQMPAQLKAAEVNFRATDQLTDYIRVNDANKSSEAGGIVFEDELSPMLHNGIVLEGELPTTLQSGIVLQGELSTMLQSRQVQQLGSELLSNNDNNVVALTVWNVDQQVGNEGRERESTT